MSIVKHSKPVKRVTRTKTRGGNSAPIVCKTWKKYGEMLRKHFSPVAYGPKGQPIYDLEETAKRYLPPSDETR